ncbi:MAG: SOS response-associated peptidase [Leptothrix sp. (in: b-proteobacteria)]
MCNLYHLSPPNDLQTHFRARVRSGAVWPVGVVGPFGVGGFVRPGADGLEAVVGQWGMVPPGSAARRPAARTILTNNARAEGLAERPTYRGAWQRGQRCLIPASWFQEPNWETGRNHWWQLRRADGAPWALAGIWADWTDPASGEVLPTYSMITTCCDGHPLLGRLHKPDPKLPADAQDKRATVQIEPAHWHDWLHGDEATARALIAPAPAEVFDRSVTQPVDRLLAGAASQGSLI